MFSVPRDFEDRQAQAQGRRLDAVQDFIDRCDATTTSGETGSNAYVDCVDGFVKDTNTGLPTSTSCATACNGLCCAGGFTCDDFTGKGKQRVIHSYTLIGLGLIIVCDLYPPYSISFSL